MINSILEQLNLPELLINTSGKKVNSIDEWRDRRKELINILLQEVYGTIPPAPLDVYIKEKECIKDAFAGKANQYNIRIGFKTEKGEFTFPVNIITPQTNIKTPVIIHIAFRSDIPDKYYPAEEVVDKGFTVINMNYKDITTDDNDFGNGLASMYNRNIWTWGKIAMWAFATMRVADILDSFEYIDNENIAVMGHSRLGKTALLAGAIDERFKYVISNNSGCSGAAISRNKRGERIADICRNFEYWFCTNYKKYIDNENNTPFDQHFLLSLICPRYLYVSSAEKDIWADPINEFLTLAEVDKVYKIYKQDGFLYNNRLPQPGDTYIEGRIGYHQREGTHYLSRYDWNKFIEFITLKRMVDHEK